MKGLSQGTTTPLKYLRFGFAGALSAGLLASFVTLPFTPEKEILVGLIKVTNDSIFIRSFDV